MGPPKEVNPNRKDARSTSAAEPAPRGWAERSIFPSPVATRESYRNQLSGRRCRWRQSAQVRQTEGLLDCNDLLQRILKLIFSAHLLFELFKLPHELMVLSSREKEANVSGR